MTGFAKVEAPFDDHKLVIEIRALNSKQLDMHLRLPAQYRELEMDMRRVLSEHAGRGKIELGLSQDGGMDKRATINTTLAADYHSQLKQLSDKLALDSTSGDLIGHILKMPDVMQTEREALDPAKAKVLLEALNQACIKLNEFRDQEGAKLSQDLQGHIAKIKQRQEEVEGFIAPRIERIRARIKKNLEQQVEAKDYDPSRFEQELIFYLEKYDVSEEMTRLQGHCEYFLETLKGSEPTKGKKLGFIAQEIGREVNTLGAKSYDSDMQRLVVMMKDDLEKIKEQALNVL